MQDPPALSVVPPRFQATCKLKPVHYLINHKVLCLPRLLAWNVPANSRVFQEAVTFLLTGRESLGQASPVVFRHAVLPFQEVRDGPGRNAHFYPSQTGEQ